MITVETTDTSLRVTIPKSEVPPDRLNSFLDWLRFEATVAKGRLTDGDADHLAEEMKADWWARNKQRFVSPAE